MMWLRACSAAVGNVRLWRASRSLSKLTWRGSACSGPSHRGMSARAAHALNAGGTITHLDLGPQPGLGDPRVACCTSHREGRQNSRRSPSAPAALPPAADRPQTRTGLVERSDVREPPLRDGHQQRRWQPRNDGDRRVERGRWRCCRLGGGRRRRDGHQRAERHRECVEVLPQKRLERRQRQRARVPVGQNLVCATVRCGWRDDVSPQAGRSAPPR